MLSVDYSIDHKWSSLQEPRVSCDFPVSYLKLLSALDMGWRIQSHDLVPSWDQSGFVYRVVIQQPFSSHLEEIILPMTEYSGEILEHSGLVY
jgi:hypothetical protein